MPYLLEHMDRDYSIAPLGDHSVIIEWKQEIDPAIHRRVMSVFYYLQSLQLPYILDLIPAYASLTVIYSSAEIPPVEELISNITTDIKISPRLLEIPVCYDASLGLDITAMALQKSLSVEDIIALHTQQVYTVYMLGFLPGFPYMGKVDERLVTPRLKKPRLKVPAGSVGIAGSQTGIYSMMSPGGWNIIGQTPLKMFNPDKELPCFCNPGDQVRFVPISLDDFHKMR